MSANNPTPLFTLVRAENMETTEGLDYVSGSTQGNFRDEVKLIDGNGEPCAIPSAQGVEDLDYEYDYIDGSVGGVNRVLRQKITLKCDFLEGETRRKLHRWKQDRANVYFTPGYGSSTEVAWRPVPDSTTADLTGRYVKYCSNSPGNAHYVWDDYMQKGVMRKFAAGASRQIKTPAGAMQMFSDPSSKNHADPATPVDGNPGWGAVTGTGTITRTYIENGFGCTGAPHSYRYDFGDTTTDCKLRINTFPNMSLDTDSTVFLTVWMKGHICSDATMALIANGSTERTTISLGLMDLSSWTPVHIAYQGDWSQTSTQIIYIYTCSKTGTGSLEIGPVTISGSTSNYGVPFPQWGESNVVPVDECVSLMDVDYPNSGTSTASFWLSDRVSDMNPAVLDICHRSSGGTMYVSDTGSLNSPSLTWYNGLSNHATSFSYDLLNFGGVNTVSVVYTVNTVKYYINGTYVGYDDIPVIEQVVDLDTTTLDIGRATNGGSGIHGLLSYRLDNEKLTDDEIADLHKQLTDPGSLEVVVPARGRVFKIESIPSTPRPTAGGTHWIGNLVLRQVDYDPSLEDLTSKE